MKTIYTNVNFDYPTCGGYEIKKARKYYHIYKSSNYTGNTTETHIAVPVANANRWAKGNEAKLIDLLIGEHDEVIANGIEYDHDTKIYSKGYEVK